MSVLTVSLSLVSKVVIIPIFIGALSSSGLTPTPCATLPLPPPPSPPSSPRRSAPLFCVLRASSRPPTPVLSSHLVFSSLLSRGHHGAGEIGCVPPNSLSNPLLFVV